MIVFEEISFAQAYSSYIRELYSFIWYVLSSPNTKPSNQSEWNAVRTQSWVVVEGFAWEVNSVEFMRYYSSSYGNTSQA